MAKLPEVCRCGSGRSGRLCCKETGVWFKKPATISLRPSNRMGHVAECYFNYLGTCGSRISSEHLISKTVLDQMKGDSATITVSGFPWIPFGQSKNIGTAGLVSKNLCIEHNSDLSKLDEAAGQLFRSVRAVFGAPLVGRKEFLISGHDLERWMLKTLANMVMSRNILPAISGGCVELHNDIDLEVLLSNPQSWPPGSGIYVMGSIGVIFGYKDEVIFTPFFQVGTNTVVGIRMILQGFGFILIAAPVPGYIEMVPKLMHRQTRFTFNHPNGRGRIKFSWLSRQTGVSI